MKKILQFNSYKGKHCASNSLKEICEYYKYPISEGMAFGLSSGLYWGYIPYSTELSRIIVLRNPIFELNFFKNVGIKDAMWEGKELTFSNIQFYVDNDIPIVALTDIAYLDFYHTSSNSMGGHTLNIVGYNLKSQSVYVSDYISEDLLEISYTNLRNSMIGPVSPYGKNNLWFPISSLTIENLETLILNALKKNRKIMTEESSYYGLNSIKKCAYDLDNWINFNNWQKSCILNYRVIEKIGTGGSGFRNLYFDFLNESVRIIPELSVCLNNFPQLIDLYSEASKQMFLAGKRSEFSRLEQVKNCLLDIYHIEKQLWEDIGKIIIAKNEVIDLQSVR